jgi:putative endonuclease
VTTTKTTAKPRRTLEPSKLKGAWAEDLAAAHLERAGLQVLARNYRIRGGEIDLIAKDATGTTVFLEVKQRSSDSHGAAGEYITPRKAALVRRAALHYLGRDDLPCRFDAVLIEGRDASMARVQWLQDAF